MLIKNLFGGLMCLIIFPFVDFKAFDAGFLFWVGVNVLLFFVGNFFYYKALQVEEISKINIYWSFIPFFTFIIAWFLLGEKLSIQQIIAMGFLITGAVIAGLNIKNSAIKLSKGFWLMAIACFAYALSAVIIRFLTEDNSYMLVLFWSGVFFSIFPAIPFLSKKMRRGFSADFKDPKICLFVFVFALFDTFALILNYFSVSKGPVALVYSMEGFQIIFVFIMTAFIAYFTKIDLQENFETKNVFVKIVALFTMIIGINLL